MKKLFKIIRLWLKAWWLFEVEGRFAKTIKAMLEVERKAGIIEKNIDEVIKHKK